MSWRTAGEMARALQDGASSLEKETELLLFSATAPLGAEPAREPIEALGLPHLTAPWVATPQ
jgi:hypothetical protein